MDSQDITCHILPHPCEVFPPLVHSSQEEPIGLLRELPPNWSWGWQAQGSHPPPSASPSWAPGEQQLCLPPRLISTQLAAQGTDAKTMSWVSERMNEQINSHVKQCKAWAERKVTRSKNLPSPGIRLRALPGFLSTTHTMPWDKLLPLTFCEEEIEWSDLPKLQGQDLSWPQNTLSSIGYTAHGSPVSSPHFPGSSIC